MKELFQKSISPSLSPNTDRFDILQALQILLSPFQWKKGNDLGWVHQWFVDHFGFWEIAFFNSGRSALLALLQVFDIGEADEVLVQAFTCVAVPNSVLWAGAKPVYVDIDESYNLDPDDVEKKITQKTKAMIIQHTFGIPAQVEKLLALAKKYKILVIEDCAHALGATYKGTKLGAFGDASFFSFGRDKVVSSVWGGAAHINSKFKIQHSKLTSYEEKLKYPSLFWIFQQLLHPIAFSFILPSYNVGVGKMLLVVLQKLHLLSFPIYQEEKNGQQPKEFSRQYPNALASLLKIQLTKLDIMLQKRRSRARQYRAGLKSIANIQLPPNSNEAGWLRYPIQVEQIQNILIKAKMSGIMLGKWYHNVIDPRDVQFQMIGYKSGSCPKAELAAKKILNLPTLISEEDAMRVIQLLCN